MGSCVFVAHGLRWKHIRLQPWRYLYELARRFARQQTVVMITDCDDEEFEEEWEPGIRVIGSRLLSPRQGHALAQLIERCQPEQIWWSVTPRSVIYLPAWKRLPCPVTALVTCPIYPWGPLWRAWRHNVPWVELGALVRQRLVPRWLFARMLNDPAVSSVVTQSMKNRTLLVASGVPEEKIRHVPVGIDAQDRAALAPAKVVEARAAFDFPKQATVFGYFGAIRRIRGIYALLEAFSIAARRNPHVFLAVLARGADETTCAELNVCCARLNIADRVKVIGGWLTRDQVWANIEACDVVTLPFVLVPSDVPIAILEALARGKPVIASDVDGIPELVKGRGAVVNPLDRRALAQAMLDFAESGRHQQEMAEAARRFMAMYPDWDQVGELALGNSARRGPLDSRRRKGGVVQEANC